MNVHNVRKYKPIFLQTALQYFFDNAVIPIYSGDVVINLMDYFPLLKQGYALRDTVYLLLISYNFANNLLDANHGVILDNLYITAFRDNIPAFYYTSSFDEFRGNAARYIPMQDAVKQGLIPKALNTFEILQSLYPLFDPQRIYSVYAGYFEDIIILNSQDITTSPELFATINNEQIINALYDEFNVAEAIFITLENLYEDDPGAQFTDIELMTKAAKDVGNTALLNRLLADNRANKLIYAIMIGNINLVDQYIDLYDPRDNNFEAYNLAVEENKPIIAERIKKAIVKRNFLEQQTFQTMMLPLGSLDVPESQKFYEYSRYLASNK